MTRPQRAYDVIPDISTFTKALGNGVAVAAIAGRGPVLDGWRQDGIVQAGTYSGNSIATAAAQATVERLLTGEPMSHLDHVGTMLMDGTAKILGDRGVEAAVQGKPAMFGFYCGDTPPHDFRSAGEHNEELYESLVMGMIQRGVLPNSDALEPWFLCAALSEEDVATTLMIFFEALDEALG